MAKVRVYSVEKKERDKITDGLFDIISKLKSKKEVFNFLIGLLTESEVLMIGRRIQIAKLLIEGEGYNSIRKKLKVSHLTISNVEKWINEEIRKNLVIDKMGGAKPREFKTSGYTGSMLDKYRHHRALKKIFK